MPAEECPICLEEFKDEAYVNIETVCKHTFHFRCIVQTFLKTRNLKCPLCRQENPLPKTLDDYQNYFTQYYNGK